MRTPLIVLVAILLSASPLVAQSDTAKDRPGLIGPIRTLRVETTYLTGDGIQAKESPRVLTQTISFDERGSATENSVFNPDGSVKFKFGWNYSYDAKGREAERIFLNANGARTMRSVSRYDDKGRRIEVTFVANDGRINHVESFAYNAAGKLEQETHRNADGTMRNAQTYSYDSKGRRSDWIIYRPDGVPQQRTNSTYDDKGREIGSTVYRSDGSIAMSETRSYDDQGNLKERLRHRDGVLVSRETFSYEFDGRGNWIKRQIARETLRDGMSKKEIEVNYRALTYY
jgi:hypothetical protein